MWASLNFSLYLRSSKDRTMYFSAKKHQSKSQNTWSVFISPSLVCFVRRFMGIFLKGQYKDPVMKQSGITWFMWPMFFPDLNLTTSSWKGEVQESEAKEAKEEVPKIPKAKAKAKAKSKVFAKKPSLRLWLFFPAKRIAVWSVFFVWRSWVNWDELFF